MSIFQILGMTIDTIKTGAGCLWEFASAVPAATGSIVVIVAMAVIFLIVGR